jgi:uncharacterized membrane protein YqaE (UPF0057 family)
MKMKKIFTIALIFVAISLLLSSCSQISNSSVKKSDNTSTTYVEPVDENNSMPVRDDRNSFQEKGFSTSQTSTESGHADIIGNNAALAEQQLLLPATVPTESEMPNSTIAIDKNTIVKGIKGKVIEKNEYQSKAIVSQAVDYSRHSSNGVPFWLIVVCAIVIPPLGIALAFGIVDKFWICLALTFCFWLPGMIYALIQIL